MTTSNRDEIKRLVSSACDSGRVDNAYSGKRSRARLHAGMHLDVRTETDGEKDATPVIMHNISDTGFAFWSRQQIRQHALLWVREFSGDDANPWLTARVTHCTKGLRGYLVGAKFCDES